MARIIPAFMQFLDGNGDPLVDGWLRFTESGTNNTDKDTFSDVGEAVANTNPVQLDGEGRCPSIFGTGSYNVRSFVDSGGSPGTQIQQFDPVGGDLTGGSFSDWNSASIYGEGDLVTGSDGNYYRSLSTNNQNQDPISTASAWEEVQFLGAWNENITYAINDVVIDDSGYIYRSIQAGLNKIPSDEPEYWEPSILQTDLLTSTFTHNMTVDEDYILSVAENRNGRVIITDTGATLATARNIIVSDIDRSFFAQNDTIQILTFKTSGGSGVAVTAGSSLLLLCDGTDVIDPLTVQTAEVSESVTALGRLSQHTNLAIVNNGGNPNFQADASADEVLLEGATGNQFKISSLAQTVDLTASGAGGLDTGSEAVSTWYHIWALAKADGTKTVVFSLSTTFAGVTKPTDYIYGGYIGAIYNASTGHLLGGFVQSDDNVSVDSVTMIDGAMIGGAWTSISITTAAPPTARRVRASMNGTGRMLGLSAYSDGKDGQVISIAPTGASSTFGNLFPTARVTATSMDAPYRATMYYWNSVVTGCVVITGWSF